MLFLMLGMLANKLNLLMVRQVLEAADNHHSQLNFTKLILMERLGFRP
jgi:hypothetical protein